MISTVLLLGTNLGNRQQNLQQAQQLIADKIGKISLQSSIFESEPWGFVSEDLFLNQVLVVETQLSALRILNHTQNIEQIIGRKTKSVDNVYVSRKIDIDILFYGDEIISTDDLMIPHKMLHLRRFTLEPLSQVCPEMKHPVLNKTILCLLDECPDLLGVHIIS